MIYLNNAATTLQKPPCAAQAVVEAMSHLGNGARGGHTGEMSAARTVFQTREALAKLFGFSHPERVIFTANATQALNTALFGLLNPGDHVIATDWDHNSVLRPLHVLARERGVAVDFLSADRQGRLHYEQLEDLVRPNTKLLVCTHASNLTGNLLDVERAASFAQRHNLYFLLDAAQTAGSTPISMEEMGIDLLAFTGHKGLMGPQGTGGLCVAPRVELRPLVSGGTGVRSFEEEQPAEYPEHLEAGTLNGHGLAGLGAAVDFILDTGVETIHAHELALTRRFVQGLEEIPGVTVYGDFSGDRAPVVALNLEGWDPASAADTLAQDYDIAVRPGIHCAPRMHRALGTQDLGCLRFSFGFYTREADIDAALAALKEMADPCE